MMPLTAGKNIAIAEKKERSPCLAKISPALVGKVRKHSMKLPFIKAPMMRKSIETATKIMTGI